MISLGMRHPVIAARCPRPWCPAGKRAPATRRGGPALPGLRLARAILRAFIYAVLQYLRHYGRHPRTCWRATRAGRGLGRASPTLVSRMAARRHSRRAGGWHVTRWARQMVKRDLYRLGPDGGLPGRGHVRAARALAAAAWHPGPRGRTGHARNTAATPAVTACPPRPRTARHRATNHRFPQGADMVHFSCRAWPGYTQPVDSYVE